MNELPKNGEPIITNVRTLTLLLKGNRRERIGLKTAVLVLFLLWVASIAMQENMRADYEVTKKTVQSMLDRSNRYSAIWEERARQDSLERDLDNRIMDAFRKKYNLEP